MAYTVVQSCGTRTTFGSLTLADRYAASVGGTVQSDDRAITTQFLNVEDMGGQEPVVVARLGHEPAVVRRQPKVETVWTAAVDASKAELDAARQLYVDAFAPRQAFRRLRPNMHPMQTCTQTRVYRSRG